MKDFYGWLDELNEMSDEDFCASLDDILESPEAHAYVHGDTPSMRMYETWVQARVDAGVFPAEWSR